MFGLFNNGKIAVAEPKKVKKKHGLAFYVIGLFTLAIEVMLGVNAAFLVDQSVGVVSHNMLVGTFLEPFAALISLIVSLAVGFCMVFGGMWTFAGFMDNLDDAAAYQKKYGTNSWPVVFIWALLVGVILLDFSTLLFRAAYFAEKGALALFAFFVILIFMPPVLGPIIHVLENTPHGRRMVRARRLASALVSDDAEGAVQTMDPDLRARLVEDDDTAWDEHYQRVEDRRRANLEFEQARMQAKQDEQARKQAEKQRGQDEKNHGLPFVSASLPGQARIGSPKE